MKAFLKLFTPYYRPRNIFFVFVLAIWARSVYVDSLNGDQPPNLNNPPPYQHASIGQTFNGVKMAVPHNDQMSFMLYEDESFWVPRHRVRPPDFNSRINYFDLRIRNDTFTALRGTPDWKEFNEHSDYSYQLDRWLEIGVAYEDRVGDVKIGKSKDYSGSLRGFLDDERVGPFVRLPEKSFGLTHYDSVKKLPPDPTKIDWHAAAINVEYHSHYELFYDEEHKNRFISCQEYYVEVPPYRIWNVCNHYFYVDEIRMAVSLTYSKNVLPRWRQIEDGVRAKILSYRVQ